MNRHHPRIYPANYAILARYAPDHPAIRALQVHAEARDMCVAREIEWPNLGNRAIEQTWFSQARLRQMSFSSFAYEFISYDLILDGWLEMAPEPTEAEMNSLEDDVPLMQTLLDECEAAAIADCNEEIVPLIAKAREYIQCYLRAVLCRFEQCGIQWRPGGNFGDTVLVQ